MGRSAGTRAPPALSAPPPHEWGGALQSVPYWAPDLEAAVVVEESPPAGGKRVGRRLALGPVRVVAQVVLLVDHHVGAGIQHVGEVVDRVPVGEPDAQSGV